MQRYLLRRIVLAVPTFIGVLFVVFWAVHLVPGDVITRMLDGSYAADDPHMRAKLSAEYGLNHNVISQFLTWLVHVLEGNLGKSMISGRAVTFELRTRMPATLELGVLALLVSLVISIPVGVLSAVKQDSAPDYLARSFAILCLAVPSFWLGLLVIIYGFDWFGWTPPLVYHSLLSDPIANLGQMAAPALILGAALAGNTMRLTRAALLECLRQDYIRTARSKGLHPRSVILRHALRNSLLPIVTIIGLQLPVIIGGTVVLESIFSIPGMGSYLLTAVESRDYPAIEAIVLLSAAFVILSNLAVDAVYPLIDPRITS